jgi:hypothetical protein
MKKKTEIKKGCDLILRNRQYYSDEKMHIIFNIGEICVSIKTTPEEQKTMMYRTHKPVYEEDNTGKVTRNNEGRWIYYFRELVKKEKREIQKEKRKEKIERNKKFKPVDDSWLF